MRQVCIIVLLLLINPVFSQNSDINWIGFEELDDLLKVQNKPVFIYFYTDWCAYCKKMERHAFKDTEIVENLNQKFYAVRMNAETKDTIAFEGKVYVNEQAKYKRNGIHQIPQILASRNNSTISFPTLLVLDKDFRIKRKSHEYLPTERLKKLIED